MPGAEARAGCLSLTPLSTQRQRGSNMTATKCRELALQGLGPPAHCTNRALISSSWRDATRLGEESEITKCVTAPQSKWAPTGKRSPPSVLSVPSVQHRHLPPQDLRQQQQPHLPSSQGLYCVVCTCILGSRPHTDSDPQKLKLDHSLTDWSNCNIGMFTEGTGSIRCQDTRKARQRLDNAASCVWGKSIDIQQKFLGQTSPSGTPEAGFTCPLTQPVGTDPDISYEKALEECGWATSNAVEEAMQWFAVDWAYGVKPDQIGLSGCAPMIKSLYDWGAAWDDASCSMNARFVEDPRGYNSVFDKIGESFLTGNSASGEPRLVLGAQVVRIEYDDTTVRVTTRQTGGVQKVYVAKQAIITFSTGVLQRSKSDTNADVVRFQPPLPNWKKKAIDRLPMGQFTKLFLRFESKCWDDKPWFMLGATEERKFPMWANFNMLSGFEDSNILVAFQIGSQSSVSEASSQEAQLADVMRHLRMMFPSCPDPIEHFFTSWSTDKWTFGAYSYRPTNVTPRITKPKPSHPRPPLFMSHPCSCQPTVPGAQLRSACPSTSSEEPSFCGRGNVSNYVWISARSFYYWSAICLRNCRLPQRPLRGGGRLPRGVRNCHLKNRYQKVPDLRNRAAESPSGHGQK